MPLKDKQERSAYNQQYYRNNVERAKVAMRKRYEADPDYFNDRNTARRQELREFLQQQKIGLACKRCGNSDFRVLDFHHLDKDGKEGSLGKAVSENWSKKRILQEIAKCEVLCANCHRILHWEERYSDASSVPCSTAKG